MLITFEGKISQRLNNYTRSLTQFHTIICHLFAYPPLPLRWWRHLWTAPNMCVLFCWPTFVSVDTIQIDVCISGLLMKLPSYLDQEITNLKGRSAPAWSSQRPNSRIKNRHCTQQLKKSIWRLYSMSTIKPSDRLIKAIHLSGEAPKLGESEAEALVRWEFTEYLVCITVTQHNTEGSQNVYCKAKEETCL